MSDTGFETRKALERKRNSILYHLERSEQRGEWSKVDLLNDSLCDIESELKVYEKKEIVKKT